MHGAPQVGLCNQPVRVQYRDAEMDSIMLQCVPSLQGCYTKQSNKIAVLSVKIDCTAEVYMHRTVCFVPLDITLDLDNVLCQYATVWVPDNTLHLTTFGTHVHHTRLKMT